MHAWLHTVCVHWLHRLKRGRGVGSPGAGFTGGRELPCGCWELGLGPVEEKPVLLTAELSLKLVWLNSLMYSYLVLLKI